MIRRHDVSKLIFGDRGEEQWEFRTFSFDKNGLSEVLESLDDNPDGVGLGREMELLQFDSCQDVSNESTLTLSCFKSMEGDVALGEIHDDGSFSPVAKFGIVGNSVGCLITDGPAVWILCDTVVDAKCSRNKEVKQGRIYCAVKCQKTERWHVTWSHLVSSSKSDKDSMYNSDSIRILSGKLQMLSSKSTSAGDSEVYVSSLATVVSGDNDTREFVTWNCCLSVGSLWRERGFLGNRIPTVYAEYAQCAWVEEGSVDFKQREDSRILLGTKDGRILEFKSERYTRESKVSNEAIVDIQVAGSYSKNPIAMVTSSLTKGAKESLIKDSLCVSLMAYHRSDSKGESRMLNQLKAYPNACDQGVWQALPEGGGYYFAIPVEQIQSLETWNGQDGIEIIAIDKLLEIRETDTKNDSSPTRISPYFSVYSSLLSEITRQRQVISNIRDTIRQKKNLAHFSKSLLVDILTDSSSDINSSSRHKYEIDGMIHLAGNDNKINTVKDNESNVSAATENKENQWTSGSLQPVWRTISPYSCLDSKPRIKETVHPLELCNLSIYVDGMTRSLRICASVMFFQDQKDVFLEVWGIGLALRLESAMCGTAKSHTVVQLKASLALREIMVTKEAKRPPVLSIAVGFKRSKGCSYIHLQDIRLPTFPPNGKIFSLKNTVLGPIADPEEFSYRQTLFIKASEGLSGRVNIALEKSLGLLRVGGSELDQILIPENISKRHRKKLDRLSVAWWRMRTECAQTFLQIRVEKLLTGFELLVFADCWKTMAFVLSCLEEAGTSSSQKYLGNHTSRSQAAEKIVQLGDACNVECEALLSEWYGCIDYMIKSLQHLLETPGRMANKNKSGKRPVGIFRLFKGVRSVELAREYVRILAEAVEKLLAVDDRALRVLFNEARPS